jgi:DinB superfamily
MRREQSFIARFSMRGRSQRGRCRACVRRPRRRPGRWSKAGWNPEKGTGMNYDLRDSDLAAILAEASGVAVETRRVFARLSDEQLNWKPSEREWSIGQCFDHLIISNRPYVQIFEEVLAGRRRPRLWERMPLLPRLFGTLLINTLRPDSGRRTKTRRVLYPSSSHIAPTIIVTFLDQQERLVRLMQASRGLDLDGITITSPVLRLVTYSLMDACRIIVVHEQNHVVQATRVMESPGFPG